MFLSSFSTNLPAFYHECRSLIGYTTHCLFYDSAHKGACSRNRIVQQICPWSLLPHIKQGTLILMREQNSEAKVLLRNIFFSARNRWCRRGSFAPGACCRSVRWEQAPSCVQAYNVQWLELVYEMATFYLFAKVLEDNFDEKR